MLEKEKIMKNPVPRAAAIHDLSGFGRASLTVVIPILSTLGVQVCPVPTAVLSNITGGFDEFSFIDLTEHMKEMLVRWKKIGMTFDAVYSGFLGSAEQVEIVEDYISAFNSDRTLIVVDPVMGDNGKLYATMTPEIIDGMKTLVSRADIITPNITEAAFLLDEPCREEITEDEAKDWAARLSDMGPEKVIITSVPVTGKSRTSSVIALNSLDDRYWKVDCSYIPAHYPGTGDTFASIITGSLLQGDSLPIALDRAVNFIQLAIRATFGYHNYPSREGVMLEKVLSSLNGPVMMSSYEIME